MMPDDFARVFAALKPAFADVAAQLAVATDTAEEYLLVGRVPSPFAQHKGHPLQFGSVRVGKSYVSVHLLPLPELKTAISPALQKRMQGKSCFNFKSQPDAESIAELRTLAQAGHQLWAGRQWL